MIQHYPMVRFLVRSVLLWANEPGLEKFAWTGIALTSTGEILADILGNTSLLISRESSASESLSEAKTSVAGLQSLNSPLVNPIITPRLIEEKSQRQFFFRFVPTCSRELLRDLGDLAASKRLHIQVKLQFTHLLMIVGIQHTLQKDT